MERFTAYVSSEERAALRKLSGQMRVSENYVVRLALRQLLLIPDPEPANEEEERV